MDQFAFHQSPILRVWRQTHELTFRIRDDVLEQLSGAEPIVIGKMGFIAVNIVLCQRQALYSQPKQNLPEETLFRQLDGLQNCNQAKLR
jgi:hypothetical protein